MRKIGIILLLLIISSCNGQENRTTNESTHKTVKIANDNIEIVLKKQLLQGTTYNIDEPAAGLQAIQFEIQELEAIVSIAKKELNSNGFKELSDRVFSEKIQNVFRRRIDYDTTYRFLYINFLDKCNRDFVLYNNNELDYEGVFVDKNEKIITKFYYIPELVDYKIEYSQLIDLEKSKIIRKSNIDDLEIEIDHWKDISDLSERRQNNIQTLVNRNKYLFNDNKASLAWLKVNDTYFLESLVKIFGYTEDKDLLNWVMERNRKNSDDFLAKYLFTKNCEGELEIRKGILDHIENITNNDNHDYFDGLSTLYYNPKSSFDWDNFTKDEQLKMLGYLANTNDYLVMEYDQLGYDSSGRWTLLGSIFYNYTHSDNEQKWDELVQHFKKNNYYGLPHLKAAISYAYNYESGSY